MAGSGHVISLRSMRGIGGGQVGKPDWQIPERAQVQKAILFLSQIERVTT